MSLCWWPRIIQASYARTIEQLPIDGVVNLAAAPVTACCDGFQKWKCLRRSSRHNWFQGSSCGHWSRVRASFGTLTSFCMSHSRALGVYHEHSLTEFGKSNRWFFRLFCRTCFICQAYRRHTKFENAYAFVQDESKLSTLLPSISWLRKRKTSFTIILSTAKLLHQRMGRAMEIRKIVGQNWIWLLLRYVNGIWKGAFVWRI